MKYTWKPDLPDQRDYKFVSADAELPSKVDLRDRYFYIYNQGNLGSCTANSIAMGIDVERVKQGKKHIHPSRLFIYFNERTIEGTVDQDSGAQIRDGIKSVASPGICPESEWPYIIEQFTVKPSDKCYTDAPEYAIKNYYRIDNTSLSDLKNCLASGYGFVFGFTVYQSFESETVAQTGQVPMPGAHERVLGGHAVLCLGYDDSIQKFIVRNSWGESWGDKGHFYIPYDYLTNDNLAADFWAITLD